MVPSDVSMTTVVVGMRGTPARDGARGAPADGPPAPGRSLLDAADRQDDDVLGGPVARADLDGLDLVDDVHAGDDLAEDGVAGRVGVLVEELVVGDVDEELAGGAVRVVGAGHGDGAALV